MDESIDWYVDKDDEDDDDDLDMAITACGWPVNSEEISKHSTPPPLPATTTTFGVRRFPGGNESKVKIPCESRRFTMQTYRVHRHRARFCVLSCCYLGVAVFLCDVLAASKNNNRGINDINLHLRATRRGDEIDSFHSSEGLRDRESKLTISNSEWRISKNAEFDVGNKSRLKNKYGLANQMKLQGFQNQEDHNNDCGKSILTSNNTGKYVYSHCIEV